MKGVGTWVSIYDQAWRAGLDSLAPDSYDIYSEPEYAQLYESEGVFAECFIFKAEQHTFLYPFLRQTVPSFPGTYDVCSVYGYGGPVSNSLDTSFLSDALRTFRYHAAQRGIIAEVIKCHPLLENQTLLAAGKYDGTLLKMCDVVYVVVDMNEEIRWRDVYSHANRKNINKCRRMGAQFAMSQDDVVWEAFLRLYAETMAANAAPSFYNFSPRYFQLIRDKLEPRYKIAVVKVDETFAAAMMVFYDSRTAHCHLLGTERSMMSMGVNNFLHHELIQWCKIQGIQKLIIGGGRTNSDQDSLLLFKKNFSDKVAPFFVAESVLCPERYRKICDNWTSQNPERVVVGRLLKYRA